MKNRKRVASFVFNPFTNDSRVLKEAVSLQKNGYDVSIVAHGDKNLASFEKYEGIKIFRISYLNRKKTKSIFIKILAYLFYLIKSSVLHRNYEYLHCNDLNTLPIGFLIKKIFNKNVIIIYDAHEYETETLGLKGLRKKIIKIVEKYLIKYANSVITVSNSIAEEYKKLYDIIKPNLVLNTPLYIEIEKKNIFRETFGIKKESNIFLYQGLLSNGRGIDLMLQTFKQINDSNNVIVFMGHGHLVDIIKKAGNEYENIFYHESVNMNVLLDYTCSADFGITFVEDTCLNHQYCSPNKLFEYIMAEIPVVVSNLYELKKLVEYYKVGTVVTENNIKGLKQAIFNIIELDRNKLLVNLRKAKVNLNWEEQEKVLMKVYSEETSKINEGK